MREFCAVAIVLLNYWGHVGQDKRQLMCGEGPGAPVVANQTQQDENMRELQD